MHKVLRYATTLLCCRSLMALGLVIKKLTEGQAHVNYRDSRLTFLLQACWVWVGRDAGHCPKNLFAPFPKKPASSHFWGQ